MLHETHESTPPHANQQVRSEVPRWAQGVVLAVLTRLAQLILLVSGGAAGWFGLSLLNRDSEQAVVGLGLLGGALALFGIVAVWVQRTATLTVNTEGLNVWATIEPALSRGWMLGVGLLCSITAVVLANEPWMRPWPVLMLWGAGAALFPLGLRQMGLGAQQPDPAHAEVGVFTRGEVLIVAALSVAALALRAVSLDSIPFPVHGDEGEMGLVARSILNGEATNPFETVWLGHPMAWFFGQALSLTLFGNDLHGLRMLSALLGAATIPACYVLFRPLVGRGVALTTAVLLMGFHFHLHYSRIALNNIGDPLMGMLIFAAFFHAVRTRSALSLGLTGLLIGLAQHLYFGTRLLPIVLAAVIVHQLIFARRDLFQLGRHWLWLPLGLLIGLGPLLRFYLEHSFIYMERLGSVGLFQTGRFDELRQTGASVEAIMFDQVRQSIGMLFWRADSGLFYWSNSPLLDQVSALLFLLGVAVLITRPKRPESALVLSWLTGMLVFGAILLIDPPQTPRYITIAPAICFLIALGLERLKLFLHTIIGLPLRIGTALSVVVITGILAWNLHLYFQIVTPRYYYGGSLNVTTAAYTLKELPPKRFVYSFCFPAFYITHGTMRFLAPGISGVDIVAPLTSLNDLPGLPEGWRPFFILLPERTADLELIRSRYPNGVFKEYRDPYRTDQILFVTYDPR